MTGSRLLALTLAVLGGAICSLKVAWQILQLLTGFGVELDPADLGQEVAAVGVMALTFLVSPVMGICPGSINA